MENKIRYIHYGDYVYRTPNPITNKAHWVKPHGGLWASRKDGDFTWKDWCEREEFRTDTFHEFFEFTLKDGARVLTLSKIEQLNDLPKFKGYDPENQYSTCCLDFESLAKEYDAIELTDIHAFYFALYGWDCNCILIMNPDIVEVVNPISCDPLKEKERLKKVEDAANKRIHELVDSGRMIVPLHEFVSAIYEALGLDELHIDDLHGSDLYGYDLHGWKVDHKVSEHGVSLFDSDFLQIKYEDEQM